MTRPCQNQVTVSPKYKILLVTIFYPSILGLFASFHPLKNIIKVMNLKDNNQKQSANYLNQTLPVKLFYDYA